MITPHYYLYLFQIVVFQVYYYDIRTLTKLQKSFFSENFPVVLKLNKCKHISTRLHPGVGKDSITLVVQEGCCRVQ